MNEYARQYADYQAAVEAGLRQCLPEQPDEEGGRVIQAARYSLLNGGKRLRPVLLLAAGRMLGVELQTALPFACALEMIHTYSLIHDDLPCMDNDDLRRGQPTCHVAFGEAMAVLAGDALLNLAYETLLAAVGPACPGSLDAARRIAAAAGSRGMIGGQALDLAAENRTVSAGELRRLHRMKTGALLLAPVQAAVSLAGTAEPAAGHLEQYAAAQGLAFQIRDDILDVISDSSSLGKSAGKDQRDRKSTYVSLFGLEKARQMLDDNLQIARDHLARLGAYGLDTRFLASLAEHLQIKAG